jgi:hypothetical protein
MTMREQESISGNFLAGSGCSAPGDVPGSLSLREGAVAAFPMPLFEHGAGMQHQRHSFD